MRLALYIKHLLASASIGQSLIACDHLLKYRRLLRHPELAELLAEPAVIQRLLRQRIQPDWSCIDGGAHIGSVLARLVRLAPRGTHMAFEPIPWKARWLRRRYPSVEVRAVALAEEPGEVSFFENLSRPGFSSVDPKRRKSDRLVERRATADTLDRLVPAERSIRFIKLDVEGAELAALTGGAGLIERCRPFVLFESGPSRLRNGDDDALRLYDFFRTRRYDVYTPRDALFGRDPLTRDAFLDGHRYPCRAFNYAAIPSEQRVGSAAVQSA